MNKICAIHQPNFLPWIGYFNKIAKADVFVILDNVDIEINTSKAITNRTRIKTPLGSPWLTIPIKKNNSKKIMDVEMVDGNWKKKMLKTIQQNYGRAKFYKEFYPILTQILENPINNLSEYNTQAIKSLCRNIGIETDIVKSSELSIETEDRNGRIIEICKKVGANIYLSGKGGRNYHDDTIFLKNDIKIQYSDYEHVRYAQMHGEFIEGLSIVDYLFCSNDHEIWK